MNNPFNMFGMLGSLLQMRFGTKENMFGAINNFASQFDPKTTNPEQIARGYVENGQLSQDQFNTIYNISEGIYSMMGGGNGKR